MWAPRLARQPWALGLGEKRAGLKQESTERTCKHVRGLLSSSMSYFMDHYIDYVERNGRGVAIPSLRYFLFCCSFTEAPFPVLAQAAV